MARKPFEQLPFDEVPDAPRVPHAYDRAIARTLRIRSEPFGDVDVHVRTFGHGPPLVCIHGLMTSSYSFRYVLEPLGERFTVHVPDLVGAGRSSKPVGRSYGPDAVARSIGETMRELGVWGAPVIGNSMGGYLAMRLALLEPGAMSRLVNLHSPGLPTARMFALSTAFSVVPRAPRLLERLVRRNAERWVHKNVHYFDETLKSREEHREYASALLDEGGIAAFAGFLGETLSVREMIAFERRLRALDRFPIPLQLVYAEKDPMVPASVGDRLARLLPGAEFVRLERASHFAHVDAPEAFLRAALPFLERGAERAARA